MNQDRLKLVESPPGLEFVRSFRDANSTRDHGCESVNSGGHHGVPQVPVGDSHEPGGDSKNRPGTGDPMDAATRSIFCFAGAVSEGPDRGDCSNPETTQCDQPTHDINTNGHSCSDAEFTLGAGIFSSDRRRVFGSKWSPVDTRDVPRRHFQAAAAPVPKMPASYGESGERESSESAGSPGNSHEPAARTASAPTGQQLALTSQALETLGKQEGIIPIQPRFGYLTWVTARAKSANAAMLDFIGYIQARQSLEAQAIPQNQH